MRKKTQALCIVAHPDDETIWMGGTILKNKEWDWTILSLCRKDDPDRMPKFRKVCEFYRAKGIITDLDDEKLNPLTMATVIGKIKENLSSHEFDFVFTHGENGEYGHRRHKEIHKAVKALVKKKELQCKNVYFFSYDMTNQIDPEIPVPVEADITFSLSQTELEKKRRIVTNVYGFSEGSFEARSCHGKEAFVVQ